MNASLLGKPGYAYSTLTADEQAAYLDICERIRNLEVIDARDYPRISTTDISRILIGIDMDHPEFFWMDGYMNRLARMITAADQSANASNDTIFDAWDNAVDINGDGMVSMTERLSASASAQQFENPALRWAIVKKLKPSRAWNKSEIARLQEDVEARVAECRALIHAGASDYQIVRTCFEYICRTTSYDLDDVMSKQDIRSVFLDGTSVCKGYAEAFQYLLLTFGVPCFNVWGMVKKDGDRLNVLHAWNYVKVGSGWSTVDPTLGDLELHRAPDLSDKLPAWYPKQIVDYSCMCVMDDSHLPIGLIPLPTTGRTSDYFLNERTEVVAGNERTVEPGVLRILRGEEPYLCFKVYGEIDNMMQWFANAAGRVTKEYARVCGAPAVARARCIKMRRHDEIFTLYFE